MLSSQHGRPGAVFGRAAGLAEREARNGERGEDHDEAHYLLACSLPKMVDYCRISRSCKREIENALLIACGLLTCFANRLKEKEIICVAGSEGAPPSQWQQ